MLIKNNTMKKFYTLILMMSLSLFTFAQTFVSEDFSSGQMPPADWTIDGYATQWESSSSTKAGGGAPEAHFTYVQSVGVSRLISPAVDLTGITSVNVRFNQFYDNYSGTDPKVGVATRSGGGDWNIAWELGPSGDIGPENRIVEITNADVGASDFQFCIYIDGNFYNMDNWFIDDIFLYAPLTLDGELARITTSSYVSGAAEITGVVSNYGIETITAIDINWQITDGDINTTSISDISIASTESYDFICDQLFEFPIGEYELSVWISNINGGDDNDPNNDLLTKHINVISFIDSHNPLFEEFTSSTCPPCATFNNSFVPWVADHDDDIVLVKYQMDWPGSGDPYYIADAGVRRQYYGVTSVPALFGDGLTAATSMPGVTDFYDAAIEVPSFFSIVGTHTISGTVIDINTTILPYANVTDNKLFVVVFEKITTGNIGSNGETEFHHVMMSMVTGPEGLAAEFTDREPYTFTGQVDLAGTFIEEYDDLDVAIFVQNNSSHVVNQAAYSSGDVTLATEDKLNEVAIDGTTFGDFDSDILEYNIELPDGTTEVPVITGIAIDDNARVIVVPANELPGTSIIDVFAEDLTTHKRYIFNFTVLTGVDNPTASNVKVYPNPSTGQFYITGINDANIDIFNISGQKVAEYKNSNGKMNLSNLNNGIYFLKINSDQSIITKRISINK